MEVTSEQLLEAVQIIGRSLLTTTPDRANGALAIREAVATEERRLDKALVNVWLEIQGGSRRYFIWRGKQGGEYKRDLPAEVDTKSVVIIQVDPNRHPVNDLLDKHALFVNVCLDLTDPELRDATGESGNIRVKKVLEQLRAACSPGYNNRTVARLTQPLLDKVIKSIATKNDDATKGELQSLKKTGADLRDSLAADCFLAGWLRIYPDICDLVSEKRRKSGDDERMVIGEWIRYVGSGCASGADNPVACTNGLIAKAAREGYGDQMSELAEKYCDEGDGFRENALSAQTDDDWGKALYGAGLSYYLGNRVYQGLGDRATADSTERYKYQIAKNSAEEQQVLVETALLFAVKNLDGSGFARHRDQVVAAKKSAAEQAAALIVNDLIEHQYLYPRYYKRSLA